MLKQNKNKIIVTFYKYNPNLLNQIIMKNLSTIITCMLLCIFSYTDVAAQQENISIQGTLKDASGAAVSDGSYSVEFRLYHDATGGDVKWSEEATVDVTGGIYSHYLGSITPLNEAIFGQTLYMGVKVGSFELVPRTELTYAPYTFAASRVSCSGGVGDVKYSILSPTQFAEVNGDCWVPLDGSDMSGSQLAGIMNQTTLPDMSGLFIRAPEYNEGNDPDRTTSTAIATLQEDALQQHNHEIDLVTNIAGSHTHGFTDNDSAYTGPSGTGTSTNASLYGPASDSDTTSPAGNHSHTVKGWSEGADLESGTVKTNANETRSKNMNFYIYIRIN